MEKIMINIARRYANSLILMFNKNNFINLYKDYQLIIKILSNNSNYLLNIFKNPIIKSEEKKKILDKVFEQYQFNLILCKFIYFLIEKKRIKYVDKIFYMLKVNLNNYLNQINIQIILSYNIKIDLIHALIATIEKKIKKKIIFKIVINPSILGGIQIQINNYLLDNSLKNQLLNLKKILKRGYNAKS